MRAWENVSWVAAATLLSVGCAGGGGGADDSALVDGGSGGTAAPTSTSNGSATTTTPGTSAATSGGGSGGADSMTTAGSTTSPGDGATTGSLSDTGAGSTDGGPPPECVTDDDCDPGFLCSGGTCDPGCNMMHGCPGTDSCCDGQCVDTSTDMLYCGACDTPCVAPANQAASCTGGVCTPGDCDAGYWDCDGMGATGCEATVMCTCMPGDTQSCYPFAAATEGVGPCADGVQTCNPAGTAWGACTGAVGPVSEICANSTDDDCNGIVDDIPDVDADGWTACDNDCCETTFDCSDPALVNPGAFEYVGNGVDDDCDPSTSDTTPAPACSTSSKFGSVTASNLANAMDLCQTTTTNPPLANRKWGVLNAQLRLADGSPPSAAELANMQNAQTAVLTDYGTGGIGPVVGTTMAGLASGWMRDEDDPSWTGFPSTGFGYSGNPPPSYLAAHGGVLPSSAGCSGTCPSGNGANDSVNLRLTIRVPTNAQSFHYRLRFISAEYWTWACTVYNDFYLALLQTTAAGIPPDGNISFDSYGNPLSVNNGFFEVCVANGCYTCPSGSAELAGTGMEQGNTGGSTVWLETTAPVTPGEDMVLDLTIFDVSDAYLDSLILLDGFEWDVDASDVGTNPQG